MALRSENSPGRIRPLSIKEAIALFGPLYSHSYRTEVARVHVLSDGWELSDTALLIRATIIRDRQRTKNRRAGAAVVPSKNRIGRNG